MLRGPLASKTVKRLAKHGDVLRRKERVEVEVTDAKDIKRLEAAVGSALTIVGTRRT